MKKGILCSSFSSTADYPVVLKSGSSFLPWRNLAACLENHTSRKQKANLLQRLKWKGALKDSLLCLFNFALKDTNWVT